MKTTLLNRISTILLVLSANVMFAQDLWTPSAKGGFGDAQNSSIQCLHVFKGNLYAGCGDDTAAIYSSATGNYGSWQRKFSSSSIYGMRSLATTAEGGGYIYASTYSFGTTPAQVYRSFDGNTWTDIYDGYSGELTNLTAFKGLGTVDSIYVVEKSYYGDRIMRAAYDSNDPQNLSGTWDTVFDMYNTYKSINATLVYNNKFYFTTTDAALYSSADGRNWTQNMHVGIGFADNGNQELTAMADYGGYLYVSSYNYITGPQIWRSNDDSTWTMVSQFMGYQRISSLTVEGTNLWVAMNNGDGVTGAVYKSTDGLAFTSSETNGFGSNGDDGQYAQLAVFGNNMYASSQNQIQGGAPLLVTHPNTLAEKATLRGGSSYTSNGGEIWRTCLGTAPVIDLGSDQTICANQSVILNAGPGTAFSWSNGDTTQTINVNGSALGTLFYCFVTDGSGCTNSDTVKITANNVPTIGVVTPYTQHAVICLGDSTSLLNQVASNYRVNQSPINILANDSIFDNLSTYDTAAVSGVNDLAAASIVSVTIDSLYHTYDADIEIGLYAPDGSYTQLSYRNGDSGDNYIGTVFAASSLADITASTSPFTGTYAPQGGFNSFSGPADGNWILAVTDYSGGDEGIIKGWSMQFSVADTILTLSWTPSTGLSSATISSPEVTPPSGTTIYTLTATNNTGCSSQINDTIVVPAIHITASADSLCAGGTAALNVTGAINPTWSPAASLSSTSGFSVTAFPAATTTYAVSDSVSGCYTQDSVTIHMDAALVVNAGADQTICHGDSATIAGVVGGGTSPFTYLWSNGASTLSEIVSPAGTTNYGLTVSDAFGCSKTNNTNINVNASTDIYGHVTYTGGNVSASNVVIYKYEPFLVHFDTIQVSTTDAGGNYHFTAIDHFTYLIEVFPAATYTTLVPTYYGNSFLWDSATIVTHDCMMADTFNIAATEEVNFGTGPGYLHGQIVQGPGYDSHPGYPTIGGSHERVPGEPIPGIDVKLGRNPGGQMVTSTSTNGTGEYTFANVAYGNYTVYADVPGLGRDSSYTFTVDSTNYYYNYLNYVVDSTTIHYVPNAGVGVQTLVKNENRLNVYPNPSKGDATIEYSIDADAEVSLGIYNVLGVKVAELVNTHQQAGTYKYSVNDKNTGLNSGVYFVTLIANGKTTIHRIVVTE